MKSRFNRIAIWGIFLTAIGLSAACSNIKITKGSSNSSLPVVSDHVDPLPTAAPSSSPGPSPSPAAGSLITIEMLPYADAAYNPVTGDMIPITPAHEQFILFLEQQGIVLSNGEKSLIRADSPQVQILFKYLFQGRVTGAVPNVNPNGVLDSATFELEVLFKDVSNNVVRTVRVTSDQFPSRTDMRMQYTYDVNGSGNPDPQGSTRFMALPTFIRGSLPNQSTLEVVSSGSFRTGSKENLGQTLNLIYGNFYAPTPVSSTILRNKNFKQQSLCGFVQGSFLNSICGS